MARRVKKNVSVYGITQAELTEYRARDATVKLAIADRETRRKSLLARTLDGASVEPGDLIAQVITREVHRFTADEVGRILGLDVLAEIRTQLAPAIERSFSVIEVPA